MSLDGDYDPDNIFAKIVRGEAPCAKVFEDARHLAFMDVFPQGARPLPGDPQARPRRATCWTSNPRR